MRGMSRALLRFIIVIAILWTFGAVRYDGPLSSIGNLILAIAWLALLIGLLAKTWSSAKRPIILLAGLAVVVIPWLFKSPSNTRDWSPEYARTAGAEVTGDIVTFTNFRNFDYTREGAVTERWETRRYHLSKLRGIDFFLNFWGSELVAHPIFSFDFGDEGHVAFSIETRREKDETFTTLGGLFKLYELIYLVGDERDFIRHRTNVREDEDAYLYRLSAGPDEARERLLEYVEQIHRLSNKPRFYNVITANCTTAIRSQLDRDGGLIPDIRLLLNGKLDEMFEDHDLFSVKDLPLDELKARGHIDEKAMKAHNDSDFSEKIRQGVPGYEP